MYVFINTKAGIWEVGFYIYNPKCKFVAQEEYATKKEARAAVHYLNGGN
jgi:hypothetical protein